jgi:competence protein ComEC
MDWWFITFFLGALLSLFLPTVPTIFCVVLCLVFASVIFCFEKSRKYTGLFLGCAWVLYHGLVYQEAKQRYTSLESESIRSPVIIQGEISSLPQLKNQTQRFNFSITHINHKLIKYGHEVRLSWKNKQHIHFNTLSQGQKWQLNVRLKPAHGLANVGGFSYQTWLRKNGLVATGYVINKKSIDKRISKKGVLKVNIVNKRLQNTVTIRQSLYQKLSTLLPNNDLSPIVLALTFGERSGLTKEHWQVLKNTATQHLIAISGLHLGLVAGGAYAFFSWLMNVLPLRLLLSGTFQQKLLRINNKIIVILLTLLFALFYSYLAGFSVPTSRALLMLILYWGARGLGVKLSTTKLILLTVFFIILFSPFSLFSNSFWLSLYAVSVIFFMLWRFRTKFSSQHSSEQYLSQQYSNKKIVINKVKHWFLSLFHLQIGLIFLMIPITVQFNHQLSLLALPANLVAVPWMSFTAIPLSLLSVIFAPFNHAISSFFIELSLLSLSFLWQYLTWLSEFSLAEIRVSLFDWGCLVVTSLLIILYFFAGLTFRHLLVICFVMSTLGYLYFKDKAVSANTWQVNVMDVGQGLSIVIETKAIDSKKSEDKVLIYDTGASFPSGFSMSETVLVPYLISQGYQTIDKLIISHDDNDHAGGLSLLTEQFPVEQIIYNDSEKYFQCLSGTMMTWQHLTIDFLWPDKPEAKHNDDSCVIKISDGRRSVLLTGDISKKVERQLIRQYSSSAVEEKQVLNADILIVPHHGSKTSSSVTFIEHVSPQYAVFSAGYLNRWNMPVESVEERYIQRNIHTLNTAENGMVQFIITPHDITVKSHRQNLWPFWFAN